MAKLVMYNNNFFFLHPVNFDKCDMEFEIYSLGGELIGSTIYGIKEEANLFSCEQSS